MRYLNSALARFDALFVIPVYQVFWMISGIMGGLIVFDEYTAFDQLQVIMFPIGCVLTSLGIVALTFRDNSSGECKHVMDDCDRT